MTVEADAASQSRQVPSLARIITELTSPALVNIGLPLVIGAHAKGSIWWSFSVSLCAGVVPFTFILLGIRAARLSDHHVTVRDERPGVMAFILSSLIVGLAIQIIWNAPRPIVALTASMLTTLFVLAVITIARRFKVSVHAAVAAGSVVMLVETFGAWALLLTTLVPAVMWSRVQVEEHNVVQVYLGAAVGALVAGLTFGLIA